MTNRRKSWKNDLFVKFMSTVAAGFIIASYNVLTTYILEDSKFRGEMVQFKKDATTDIKENKGDITRIDAKQIGRTENVEYSGLLKIGDTKTIERLCKQIIKDTCP